MKTMFIEARRKNFPSIEGKLDSIRGKVSILYSIQFKGLAEEVKKELGKRKEVKILGIQQVLGCSKVRSKADYFLLVGEAKFHAINIAIESGKEVRVFDGHAIYSIGKEEIERERKKIEGKKARFLMANKIGLIISTKPGQNHMQEALKFKEKAEKRWKDKEFFLFMTDNLSLSELENFDIEIWVNFACPGIQMDSNKIVNSYDVSRLL